jgi:hypothetical protein
MHFREYRECTMSVIERCAPPELTETPLHEDPLRFSSVYTLAARAMITAERVDLPDTETSDIDTLQQRAQQLGRLLEIKSDQGLRTPFSTGAEPFPHHVSALTKAIGAGDLEAQARSGIDLRQVHLDTLAEAIIAGRPIEFQITSQACMRQFPLQNGVTEASTGTDWSETVTARAHRLLRTGIHNAGGYLRTNTLTIYDPTSTLASHASTLAAQDKASADVIETVMALRRRGIIDDDDTIGRDTYIKLLSQGDAAQLMPLINILQRSPYGTVVGPDYPSEDDGDRRRSLTTFMPHPGYIEYAAQLAGQTPEMVQRTGLPLYSPGETLVGSESYVFSSALLALDSLTKSTRALRITVENEPQAELHQQAAALARFAGNAGMELSQTIYHNGTNAAAMFMETALARALLPHVYQFQRSLGRRGNPRHYDAKEYNDYNYGDRVRKEQELLNQKAIIPGMLDIDYHCRTMVVNELHRRFKPKQFTTMYDVYCGPGTSLHRMWAPFIRDKKDGGSITGIDLSQSSIDFQDSWIAGTLDPKHAKVAELDQQLFDWTEAKPLYSDYAHDGQLITADDRARELAGTLLEDFDHLETESCEVLTDGFGTCSSGRELIDGEVDPRPPTYETFCNKQKRKFAILKPGGATVGMHMVNRTSWSGIDTKTQKPIELSSVYLASKAKIEHAYRDAGFINVFCEIVEVEEPHHTNADVVDSIPSALSTSKVGMAVVIAEKP